MPDNNINQEKEEVIKAFHLHEIQPELIQAKSTLEKVLSKLCEGNAQGDALAKELQEASRDNVTTSIWYLGQVIKYLEKIIANNQKMIKALSGKF
jgi:hypothetical protein